MLASYARFLWDAEDEEEEEEQEEEMYKTAPTSYFHGVPTHPPPIAVAS